MTSEKTQISEGFGYAKALIFGEYAVMYGAPCLVVALDRRVVARLYKGKDWIDSFAENVAECTGVSDLKDVYVEFENKDFFSNDHVKLGIGSSAAAVVAACDAVARLEGSVSGSQTDIKKAIDAHRAFQGGIGSGADVVASALGGVVLVSRCPDKPVIKRVPKEALPPCCLLATRHEAPTASFVNAAVALDQDPDYKQIIQKLTLADESFAELVCSYDPNSERRAYVESFLEKIRGFEPLLDELQKMIGRTILTPEFIKLRQLADSFEVALKTSGAGGGDIAVAFAKSSDDLQRFIRRAAECGGVVPIQVDVAPERGDVPCHTIVPPHATHDDQKLRPHADGLENALARIYVTATVDALLIAVAGSGFVFAMMGWSTLSLLQSIGFMLFGLLVGMALLRVSKKKQLDDAKLLLEADKISFDTFSHYLTSHPIDFVLASALIQSKNKADQKTDLTK